MSAAGGEAGLAPRRLAVAAIAEMLRARRGADETLEALHARAPHDAVDARDLALARAIVVAGFRHLGTIRAAIHDRLASGALPEPRLMEPVLIAACSQILALSVPAHAAVDTAVTLVREGRTARYAGLANAVLRRITAESEAILAASDPLGSDTPPWLAARWRLHYGEAAAAAIAAAHRAGPALDLTPKDDAAGLATELGGRLVLGRSVRVDDRRPVPELPGFAEGRWWVQDAAAALPARLLDAKPGESVLDLCAAPGGKTAQLAAAGAKVTALDISAPRLRRLEANLQRLGLAAEVVQADALAFAGRQFDAVLLDAPCTATGTIRRHPEVAWHRTPADLTRFADLQARLLRHAVSLVRPGGRLVFATCSLEPEEGEQRIAALLAEAPRRLERLPLSETEAAGHAIRNEAGDLRILPCHLAEDGGSDGFFASRLQVW